MGPSLATTALAVTEHASNARNLRGLLQNQKFLEKVLPLNFIVAITFLGTVYSTALKISPPDPTGSLIWL